MLKYPFRLFRVIARWTDWFPYFFQYIWCWHSASWGHHPPGLPHKYLLWLHSMQLCPLVFVLFIQVFSAELYFIICTLTISINFNIHVCGQHYCIVSILYFSSEILWKSSSVIFGVCVIVWGEVGDAYQTYQNNCNHSHFLASTSFGIWLNVAPIATR